MHFSPKSNHLDPNRTQIDVLIATDCISEGQNLQDCDYLINYDIHWNPVRIVQRFGRIDRIGSTNNYIQLVNFWPNMELDEYINLENRVKNRMVMLDLSATGEDIGFKVFKLDSTNLIAWDNESEMSEDDLFTLSDVFKEGRTKEDWIQISNLFSFQNHLSQLHYIIHVLEATNHKCSHTNISLYQKKK